MPSLTNTYLAYVFLIFLLLSILLITILLHHLFIWFCIASHPFTCSPLTYHCMHLPLPFPSSLFLFLSHSWHSLLPSAPILAQFFSISVPPVTIISSTPTQLSSNLLHADDTIFNLSFLKICHLPSLIYSQLFLSFRP